ncbi:LysR family transcriptional regulator [Xylophilus sp. GOD-11R]|uniref:LysR family transcriptional regulator n=1 Tax=Xylophilus sp. GOD-11R TaxID=3089814 RepID=UPI00298D0C4E|nr:LysR family transcriptional regulator [Xylophilus sp. GOD-11R]WPB58548.1 LysR family transcriptional regulator [Xylophilus sp. GOD-11R]
MNRPLMSAKVELRAWRQFVAVAEELHFGRAAARLHMTQPPLTQGIAQLERVLGVPLFLRSSRRVALAPAGDALLPEVRELLARAEALPERARAAAAGHAGRLRLGFVSTVGFDQLPRWVRGFRELRPQVQLDLVEATGDVQLAGLAQGELDAGLMLHAPGQAPGLLRSCRVACEPLVLAMPADHPLAALEHPSWADVLEQPLVVFPRRILPSIHDAILGLYHQRGRLPPVVQEAIQMQTIVNLVSAGIGFAWVPESVTRFRREGVVYRTPAGTTADRAVADLPACETSLVWPGDNPNPALHAFVDFVRERAGHNTAPC